MKQLLAGLTLLIAAPAGLAAHPLPAPAIDPAFQIEVALSSDFWEAPLTVALPLRAQVRNLGVRARRIELVFTATAPLGLRGDTCRTRQEVTVEPHSTTIVEVVVPLCPRDSTLPFWNIRVVAEVRGDAVSTEAEIVSRHVAPTGAWTKMSPPLAMSESVATVSWEPLRVELEGKSIGLVGSRFSSRELPGDWRAWSGFSGVIMTGEEWRGLDARARTGLLSWVAAGGSLFLAGEPAEPGGPGAHGLGRIAALPGNGAELDAATVAPIVIALASPALDELPDHAGSPLAARIGERETPRATLGLLVLLYAAAVGPLNLWLCRGPRRPYVFWTTPLIAFATCLVLVIAIVFRDGMGGRGYRLTALVSLPGESGEVLLQEQVSRTGVLAGRGFAVRDTVLLVPMPLGAAPGRRLFDVAGNLHSGDWFASRATQGQLVESVRPSRSRLVFSGAPTGPRVVSSFPGTLRELHYVDDAGMAWTSQNVPPGRSVTLAASQPVKMQQGWAHQLRWAGPRTRLLLQRVPNKAGWFYATTDTVPGAPLDAGASLRWEDEPLLLVGSTR